MFDFFRRHTRVLQFVLVLLIFPSFVFFGIQGYSGFTDGAQKTVAEVDGHKITQQEFEANLRERIEQARRQMPTLDVKLFDTPQMRQLALDAMVRDRVLLAAADRLHLAPGDERLERLFKTAPEFASLRNPDGSVNRDAIASMGMSSQAFAERLRQDLALRQVLTPLADSSLAPATAASAALDALYQQRELQVARFQTADYLPKVQPTDAQIEAYYKDPANAGRLTSPEEASIEYVVLDGEAIRRTVAASDADLRAYYQENIKRWSQPEERQASHILIAVDKDAPKADRDAARARAEGLLAQVRKDPSTFAALAKANSADDTTAQKGGQLEFQARGALLDLKPFEDAIFALQPGQIGELVQTDFGYHVVRLDAVRGGTTKPFEAVKAEIEKEVRDQVATREFSKAAVEFGDVVYEQSDSLKPAADRWKLEIRKADRVARAPAAGASGPLANPAFLEALFDVESVSSKRNTRAIDVGANQLVSGRIVEHRAPRLKPLPEVKDQIRAALANEQAAALARKEGNARLEAVRANPQQPLSSETVIVSRLQPRELPTLLLDAVLKAPAAQLPLVLGVDLGSQGYVLAKVTRAWGRDPAASTNAADATAQYARLWGAAESDAYVAALKDRFKVKVNAPGSLGSADASASAPR